MDIDLSVNDINRGHWIEKPSPQKKKPIIVQFAQYNDRIKVFWNNKKLKDSGISITESLTLRQMEELSKAHNDHGSKNMWTINGKILSKENGNAKAILFYG